MSTMTVRSRMVRAATAACIAGAATVAFVGAAHADAQPDGASVAAAAAGGNGQPPPQQPPPQQPGPPNRGPQDPSQGTTRGTIHGQTQGDSQGPTSQGQTQGNMVGGDNGGQHGTASGGNGGGCASRDLTTKCKGGDRQPAGELTTNNKQLAHTGASVAPMVLGGAAALLIGGAALRIVPRRLARRTND